MAKLSTLPVHLEYSEGTKAAVQEFNASLLRLADERTAIDTERKAILADALSGTGTAAALRKRCDGVRDKALQADIAELGLIGSLEQIEAAARTDWQGEAVRQEQIEAARRQELETAADKLGIAEQTAQRIHMVRTDPARVTAERAAGLARGKGREGLVRPDDLARLDELRASITAALSA